MAPATGRTDVLENMDMTTASLHGAGPSVDPAILPIRLITGKQLAAATGYAGVTAAFRAWCRKSGIYPVPGRPNHYDPKLVRERLDVIQGLSRPVPQETSDGAMSLVEQRRMRRHAC